MDKHVGRGVARPVTRPWPAQEPVASSPDIGYALTVLAKKVFDFVFPEEEGCVLCGKMADLRHAEEVFFALICGECLSRIPFVKRPICEICGRPLRGQAGRAAVRACGYPGRDASLISGVVPHESLGTSQHEAMGVPMHVSGVTGLTGTLDGGTSGSTVCEDCTGQGRFFVIARAVGTYDGALKELISEFKFYGRRDLAEGLGVLMAREASHERRMRNCDIIIPVPLHPVRLNERGYNQAELLARELGACLGIRVEDSMERVVGPGEQNKLGRQLRRDHIRGAFSVPYPKKIAGLRVLLADDVITTGNTANECARALLRAGAAEVCVISAAVSPFEQEWCVH